MINHELIRQKSVDSDFFNFNNLDLNDSEKIKGMLTVLRYISRANEVGVNSRFYEEFKNTAFFELSLILASPYSKIESMNINNKKDFFEFFYKECTDVANEVYVKKIKELLNSKLKNN